METYLIEALVLLAVIYIIRRTIKKNSGSKGGCGSCGCGHSKTAVDK